MTIVLPIAVLLAATFFALRRVLRSRGGDRAYSRVIVIGAAIIILVAFGLFAATQLGFIPNHAP
jgi:predicted PurR-regulated permease PerM